MNDLFYTHQKKNNTVGIILVTLITFVVMIPVGLIASTLAMSSDTWAIDWILAGLFGVSAAFLVNFLIKQFKVTATNKLRILFVFIGLVLAYTYVIGYIWAMMNHIDTHVLEIATTYPGEYIAGFIEGVLNPIGSTTFAVEVANELISYSGESLMFGLAIYVYPIVMILLVTLIPSQHLKPFDFETNKWMKKTRYKTVFAPLGRNTMKAPELRETLETGDLSFFKNNVWEAKNRNWTELNLFKDEFNEVNGLIEVVVATPGNRGSINRNQAFKPIYIDKNKLRALLNELEGHE